MLPDSGCIILMVNFFHILTETVPNKVEEIQQQQSLTEDSAADSAVNSGLGKNLVAEDELKSPYALEAAVCGFFCYYANLLLFISNILKSTFTCLIMLLSIDDGACAFSTLNTCEDQIFAVSIG